MKPYEERMNGFTTQFREQMESLYKQGYENGYRDGDSNQSENSYYQYEQGIEKMWRCVKKIILDIEDGGISLKAVRKLFNTSYYNVFKEYSANDVIKIIDEYESQQEGEERILFGDEVIVDERKFVALGSDGAGWVHLMSLDNGLTHSNIPKKCMRKTGKHYDLPSVLKQETKDDIYDEESLDL